MLTGLGGIAEIVRGSNAVRMGLSQEKELVIGSACVWRGLVADTFSLAGVEPYLVLSLLFIIVH